MRPRILACGLTTFDLAYRVNEMPGRNQKVQASHTWTSFGGPTANACATAAALGVSARLVTAVGSSPIASQIRSGLHTAGVDVIDLAPPGFEPPVSSVILDAAGNRAVVSRNAAGVGDLAVDTEVIADCSALLVDGYYLSAALALAERASQLGIPVVLDAGSWKPGLDRLLAHVDIAAISADFKHPVDIQPDTLGPSTVIVTHGSDPVEIYHQDRRIEVRVDEVDIGDTLGAGDVFHGAFVAHLALDPDKDTVAAANFATEAATDSCRFDGVHGWRSAGASQFHAELQAKFRD